MFILMWWEKVKLGNNLLIKSNNGYGLKVELNELSDYGYFVGKKSVFNNLMKVREDE